jgi:hypothetical protein
MVIVNHTSMKEFLMIFRQAAAPDQAPPSPDQMQATMRLWQDWIKGIAARNRLVSSGNSLDPDGRVMHSGELVTNGPYVEVKEAVGGYIIVRADSIDQAIGLAAGCPILAVGGNVEVRAIVAMEEDL